MTSSGKLDADAYAYFVDRHLDYDADSWSGAVVAGSDMVGYTAMSLDGIVALPDKSVTIIGVYF